MTKMESMSAIERPGNIFILNANSLVAVHTMRQLGKAKAKSVVSVGVHVNKAPSAARRLKYSSVVNDMADVASLEMAFQGVERLFIILPANEHRQQYGLNVIAAAKKSGVKFVLLMSFPLPTCKKASKKERTTWLILVVE